MKDVSIVHVNKRCFIHCLPSGAWSTATIEVTTMAGMVHRPRIVYESSSSHDKIKNNAFLLCIVVKFGHENFPVLVANSFVDTPYMHSQLQRFVLVPS